MTSMNDLTPQRRYYWKNKEKIRKYGKSYYDKQTDERFLSELKWLTNNLDNMLTEIRDRLMKLNSNDKDDQSKIIKLMEIAKLILIFKESQGDNFDPYFKLPADFSILATPVYTKLPSDIDSLIKSCDFNNIPNI